MKILTLKVLQNLLVHDSGTMDVMLTLCDIGTTTIKATSHIQNTRANNGTIALSAVCYNNAKMCFW